jgi:NADH dehydrogenase/NADH:ubiquinone oxidoreductase subunit G
MSEVTLTIDGKKVTAETGTTVLEAARKLGINIPTLCHHESLKPYTACRICVVEVTDARGRTEFDTACSHPVANNIIVKTRSEKVDKIRKLLLEMMLAHAPESLQLQEMAKEYGADANRFEKEPSFCILCGLCVRYCEEVAKKNAVTFVERGTTREIMFIPEIAMKECWDCKGCFPLCPTIALQEAFLLTRALAAPSLAEAESEE